MTDAARLTAEAVLRRGFRLAALAALLASAALLGVVVFQGLRPLLGSVAPADFLFGQEWRPEYRELFGIVPLLATTLITAVAAAVPAAIIAVPAALYVVEYLPRRWSRRLLGMAELAAGLPGVVYGFFGVMVVIPWLEQYAGLPEGRSLAAAVLVLGMMTIPTVLMHSMVAIRAVPAGYRRAAVALGADPVQTAWLVVLPAAARSVLAGVLAAAIRAAGEAAAVAMVAGNSPQLPRALGDSVRTLTATLLLEMGSAQGLHSRVLFSIGLVLFLLVLLGQWGATRLVNRKQGFSYV
ncbi:PstC family ABC transporter permease [Spirochaeta africana]|uniref:ABC-type phosphate transport system, permease component n=1 Tax=Spirochaeta africana (strain ATCC 700263 / DSM 8902 / Z-7692) TaxID=889378 RepID=H9UGU4_SPIAZ|nr:ABC transporter permease subunit [Spirochaeta africana]AFG36737.1 ABC-type phosphate transport system, permease component [Spirochaeta africana DSM 8902]